MNTFTLKTFCRLFFTGLLIFTPIVLIVGNFQNFFLGEGWNIKWILLCLLPISLCQISLWATGYSFIVSGKNFYGLVAQCFMLFFRFLPIFIIYINGFSGSLVVPILCLGSFVGYFVYGFIMFLVIK